MKLGEAFWRVMCTLLEWLPWSPVKFKCCDCGQTYYFTVDIIIADSMDNDGDPHPVIECPFCNLRHQVLVFNYRPNTPWMFMWRVGVEPQC